MKLIRLYASVTGYGPLTYTKEYKVTKETEEMFRFFVPEKGHHCATPKRFLLTPLDNNRQGGLGYTMWCTEEQVPEAKKKIIAALKKLVTINLRQANDMSAAMDAFEKEQEESAFI